MNSPENPGAEQKGQKNIVLYIILGLLAISIILILNRRENPDIAEAKKVWERCYWTYPNIVSEKLGTGVFFEDRIENAGCPGKISILAPSVFPEGKRENYLFGHMVNKRGLELDVHFFLISLGQDGLPSQRTKLFIETFPKSSFKEKMALIRAAAESQDSDDIIFFYDAPLTIKMALSPP